MIFSVSLQRRCGAYIMDVSDTVVLMFRMDDQEPGPEVILVLVAP